MNAVLQFFGRIQNRLLIAMLTVTAIPLIAVMIQASRQTTEALGKQAHESLQYQAGFRTLGLRSLFRESSMIIENLAGQREFRELVRDLADRDEAAFETFKQIVQRSLLSRLTYFEFRGISEDGTPQVAVRLTFPLIPEPSESLAKAAVNTLRIPNTAIGFSPECHGLVVVPVNVEQNGRSLRAGVLIGSLSPDTILSVVTDRGDLDSDQVSGYLLAQGPGAGRPGEVLLQPGEDGLGAVLAYGRELPSVLGDEDADQLMQRPRGLLTSANRTIAWDSFQAARIGLDLIVGVVQDREIVLQPVTEARRVFLLILGAAVVLSMVLCIVFARQLTKPIEQLRLGAQEIAAGHLDQRIAVKTGDEIEQLAAEFNRMAEALERSHADLERRIAEKTEELQQANRVLMQTEKLRSLGELAAGVAHEINNPAGIVSMYAELLLEQPDLSDRDRRKVRTILENAERIAAIAGGMLDFSRTQEFRPEPISITAPLEKALSLVSIRKIAGEVEIVRDLPEDLPWVRGDESQLLQVFINLLSNAVQAMPNGGRLGVSARRGTDGLEIRITDSGAGIPTESLDKLFEPFFTTKAPGEGTGLGLSISYGIIRNHGGQIRVEKTGPEGTTFCVTLLTSERPAGNRATEKSGDPGGSK